MIAKRNIRNKLLFLLAWLLLIKAEIKSQSNYELNLPAYNTFPFTPLYGTKMLREPVLSKDLGKQFNYTPFAPIQFAGLLFSDGPRWLGKNYFSYPFSYVAKIIPQKIGLNDSTSANISGFIVGLNFPGPDIFNTKIRHLHFFISPGINFGRLKLYNDNFRKKNVFFSPKANAMLSLQLKSIFISFSAEYEYDLSNPAWRTITGSNSKLIPNSISSTGFSAFIHLGFLLNYKIKHKVKTKPVQRPR